jgi:NADH dehydrogenase FAD-containing subunit
MKQARPPQGVHSKDKVIEAFSKTRDVISRANTIAIVGGGAVGYELAGEICERFPGKAVHLIHSGNALLDRMINPLTPATQARLVQELEAGGAHAHLGVTVDLANIISEIEKQPVAEYALPILDRTQAGNPYVIRTGDQEVKSCDR